MIPILFQWLEKTDCRAFVYCPFFFFFYRRNGSVLDLSFWSSSSSSLLEQLKAGSARRTEVHTKSLPSCHIFIVYSASMISHLLKQRWVKVKGEGFLLEIGIEMVVVFLLYCLDVDLKECGRKSSVNHTDIS